MKALKFILLSYPSRMEVQIILFMSNMHKRQKRLTKRHIGVGKLKEIWLRLYAGYVILENLEPLAFMEIFFYPLSS